MQLRIDFQFLEKDERFFHLQVNRTSERASDRCEKTSEGIKSKASSSNFNLVICFTPVKNKNSFPSSVTLQFLYRFAVIGRLKVKYVLNLLKQRIKRRPIQFIKTNTGTNKVPKTLKMGGVRISQPLLLLCWCCLRHFLVEEAEGSFLPKW